MAPTIRPAAASDLDAINAIYNHYVVHSTCTYEEAPWSAARRQAWWTELQPRFPVLVTEHDGRVVGWASLAPFRPAPGYRFTARNSIYLAPEACGRGLGRALLTRLLSAEYAAGFHSVIAGVSADQAPSLRLHRGLGFAEVARLREVGFKFGRWLDVVYLQKLLPS
jgi:phosphinothricin acetyltransferase